MLRKELVNIHLSALPPAPAAASKPPGHGEVPPRSPRPPPGPSEPPRAPQPPAPAVAVAAPSPARSPRRAVGDGSGGLGSRGSDGGPGMVVEGGQALSWS